MSTNNAVWRVTEGNARWLIKDCGGQINFVQSMKNHENAEFVARACNAHDGLVKALEKITNDTYTSLLKLGYTKQQLDSTENFINARAALAKARP